MSGVVRSVGKKLFGGDAPAQQAPQKSAGGEAPRPAARVSTPEERAIALRRRRGSRALLSEERVNAESGLGGEMTTLGGQ